MRAVAQKTWFRRINVKYLAAGWAALGGLAGSVCAVAGTITVPIETNDQVVLSDGTLRFVGDPAGRIGLGYNTTTPGDLILPFKLPTLPAGERIVSATLSVNIEGWYNSSALHNLDLYGLTAVSSTSTVNAGYYVNGLNPSGNASARLLQDDWITPSDISATSATATTVPKVSTDFAWYAQGLYDDGATAGKYGFLTLTHDAALSLMRYYTITSANSTTRPKPVITLVTGTVGRSYYVDADGGSDGGSGSALSPWKTFDHAQTVLQPGQTLYCTGSIGVVHMYSGTGLGPNGEHPYAVGTTTQPITYRAWSGKSQPHIAELIFDGVKKDTYLAFEGFLISPGPVADADYIKHNAINLTGAWHIAFTNCDIEGASLAIPAWALPVDPAASFSPYVPSSLALRQSNPAISAGYPGNASYVTIQNSRIKNTGIGIMVYENEAYAATKASRYWQILNNDISHASEDGLRFAGGDAGAGSVVRGNKIHDQDACQAMYAWYGYIYRDETRDATALADKQWMRVKQARPDGEVQTGIIYFVRLDDATDGYSQLFILPDDRSIPMLRNVSTPWQVINTDGSPIIQFRPSTQDTVVSGSTVPGTPANGDSAHTDCISVMGQMTGGFFENNRAEVSERGGGALKIENIPLKIYSTPPVYVNRHPTNVTFQNNLFYSTGNPPIKAALFIVAGGKNCWFIHNTIFGGPYYNPDGAIRLSKDATVTDTSDFKVSFYNNIIAGGGISNLSAGDPVAISEHNFWMRPPYSKVTATSRPGIVASLTTDTIMPSGATVDELIHFANFADAYAGDLHLNPGSLAARVGLPDSEAGGLTIPSGHLPTKDINGFDRDSEPDAGAYEVGSPADPVTP